MLLLRRNQGPQTINAKTEVAIPQQLRPFRKGCLCCCDISATFTILATEKERVDRLRCGCGWAAVRVARRAAIGNGGRRWGARERGPWELGARVDKTYEQ